MKSILEEGGEWAGLGHHGGLITDGNIESKETISAASMEVGDNRNSETDRDEGKDEIKKLTVNGRVDVVGNLVARRIAVASDVVSFTDWSDFVFGDDYRLRSLTDLEEFIKANKHLPEVPSAKEVSENGLDLFKMDATLLQKVEELTLYLLEQNKQLNAQNKKIQEQDQQLKEMEKFKKRLEMLEKLLLEKNK